MALQIHELSPLFEEVQLQNILEDGKTFPDCLPKRKLEDINQDYLRLSRVATLSGGTTSDFDLKKFVQENFNFPKAYSTGYKSDVNKPIKKHIEELWNILTRQPDNELSSLIPLPHPYIVPGGRFREIYYWDSYFTMLGLRASNRVDLIENMINNFSCLIEKVGYIPNGNRTYFIGRSQPPFFSLMVQLLQDVKKENDVLVKYLPSLEKEYQFWMHGFDTSTAKHRVVRLPDNSLLNRYWDENNSPRPEAYKEDVALSHQSKQKPEELFRHLRAAAESGWDFSSRWFKDENSFTTIHTTDIIPVDLNCLLFNLEQTLAEAYRISGNDKKASHYLSQSIKRKDSLLKYCWNEEKRFFFDYDFVEQKQKQHFTLAASFPLFFKIATSDQATSVAKIIESKFLKYGGLSTTLNTTGQQWDAPNGWAPLQWITYRGLLNYDLNKLAEEIRIRWTRTNLTVYQNSGKMTEKYDVWNDHGEASGGEYPNQDGFGWTNGVYLGMTEI
jgi:alpha,alpha-trehalase